MPRPYLYLILSLCTDIWPQLRTRCAGEEAVPSTCVGGARPCAGRGAVRARSATAPFRRVVPVTTPSPSEPGPSLYLRPLGRYSSGARGATAIRASALGASVNELIDTILAQKPPMLCPKGHQPFGTKAQHATLLMHLKCCNFRLPTHWSVWHHPS
jgi:hypothetical protein